MLSWFEEPYQVRKIPVDYLWLRSYSSNYDSNLSQTSVSAATPGGSCQWATELAIRYCDDFAHVTKLLEIENWLSISQSW